MNSPQFISAFYQTLKRILTTKGDILTFGTTETRLSVGANDEVLISDSGEVLGIKWGLVVLTTGVTGTLPVANGGTGVTTSTGTVNVVLSNSPILVTPALGTPASGTIDMTNVTIVGTKSEFDSALSDDTFAFLNQGNIFTQTQILQRVDTRAQFQFYDNQTTPSIGNEAAAIFFEGDTDTAEQKAYAGIRIFQENVTNATSSGSMDFAVRENNVLPVYVTLDGEGETIDLLRTVDVSGNNVITIGDLNLNNATTLTISTAVITAVQSYHTVAAETGTTDTLSTINGDTAGDILVLKADAGDTITVDNAGNILLAGGTMALTANDTITMISDGTNWREIARSVNS